MRFVQRNLWPCLALLLTGCSLVVDFPEPRDAGPGSGDGGVRPVNCDLGTHEPCREDELCCPVLDGRKKACVKKSAEKCTSCGSEGACTDPAANRCGKDTCECEPGSGQACSGDLRCSTATDKPPTCVGCDVDQDCESLGSSAQCVDHECRACDRGDPNDPLDDEGCPSNTPICNENYQCVSCSGPSDCPDKQRCIEGQGCFGCSITDPIGANGCTTDTRPICKQAGSDFQCVRCQMDIECGSGNFCDERSGQCTPVCQPYGPFGANGCPQPSKGYCKESTTGGFACQACSATSSPADCSGSKPFCSTEANHPLRGQCVQCLGDTDCPSGQVCDAGSRTCRTPIAADCKPPTPAILGTMCVECTADTNCGGTMPPYCNTGTNKCVSCAMLLPTPDMACTAKFPGTLPVCNTATGRCVRCTTNAQCSGSTPICTNNTCVACTSNTQCTGNAAGSTCVTGGPAGAPIGSCGACNPANNAGCSGSTSICNVVGGVPTCGDCMPGTPCGSTPGLTCSMAGTCPGAGSAVPPGSTGVVRTR